MKLVEKFFTFLHRFSTREKLWLLIFVWAACLIWCGSLLKRTKTFLKDWQLTTAKVNHFKFWIKNEPIVQSNLKKILTWIDPQKTYSGTQLAGQIEAFARENALTYSMTSPKTRQGDIFDAHTLQLHCENASLESLIAFESATYKTKPYIGLEKVKLRANEFNPHLIEADFDLIALQLKDLKP